VCEEAAHARAWIKRGETKLRKLRRPFLVVRYEDYVADRVSTLNSIFEFLQLPSHTLTSPPGYQKVTSEDVWADIKNADEVKKRLSRAEFLACD